MYLVPPSRLVQQEILLTVFPSFRGFLEVWVLVFGFLLFLFLVLVFFTLQEFLSVEANQVGFRVCEGF